MVMENHEKSLHLKSSKEHEPWVMGKRVQIHNDVNHSNTFLSAIYIVVLFNNWFGSDYSIVVVL